MPNSSYCVTIGLHNNPYCSNPDIGLVDDPHPPYVCLTHLSKPLKTTSEECDVSAEELRRPEIGGENLIEGWEMTIVVVSLFAVLASLAFLVAGAFCWWKKGKGNCGKDSGSSTTSIIPPPDRQKEDEMKESSPFIIQEKSAPTKEEVPLLLLHMPDPSTEDLNRMLRAWLESIDDVRVHDLTVEDESISTDQEGWVTDILDAQRSKVLVVSSDRVSKALSAVGSAAADNNALEEEGHPCEDGLHDLRVFALKRVQALLAGQYQRLMAVAFSKEEASEEADCLNKLLPHRSCMLLPEQIDQVAEWISSSSSSSSSSGDKGLLTDLKQEIIRSRRSRGTIAV